jgi:hypothetical protein
MSRVFDRFIRFYMQDYTVLVVQCLMTHVIMNTSLLNGLFALLLVCVCV